MPNIKYVKKNKHGSAPGQAASSSKSEQATTTRTRKYKRYVLGNWRVETTTTTTTRVAAGPGTTVTTSIAASDVGYNGIRARPILPKAVTTAAGNDEAMNHNYNHHPNYDLYRYRTNPTNQQPQADIAMIPATLAGEPSLPSRAMQIQMMTNRQPWPVAGFGPAPSAAIPTAVGPLLAPLTSLPPHGMWLGDSQQVQIGVGSSTEFTNISGFQPPVPRLTQPQTRAPAGLPVLSESLAIAYDWQQPSQTVQEFEAPARAGMPPVPGAELDHDIYMHMALQSVDANANGNGNANENENASAAACNIHAINYNAEQILGSSSASDAPTTLGACLGAVAQTISSECYSCSTLPTVPIAVQNDHDVDSHANDAHAVHLEFESQLASFPTPATSALAIMPMQQATPPNTPPPPPTLPPPLGLLTTNVQEDGFEVNLGVDDSFVTDFHDDSSLAINAYLHHNRDIDLAVINNTSSASPGADHDDVDDMLASQPSPNAHDCVQLQVVSAAEYVSRELGSTNSQLSSSSFQVNEASPLCLQALAEPDSRSATATDDNGVQRENDKEQEDMPYELNGFDVDKDAEVYDVEVGKELSRWMTLEMGIGGWDWGGDRGLG